MGAGIDCSEGLNRSAEQSQTRSPLVLFIGPSVQWHSLERLKKPDITIGSSPTFFAAMAAAKATRRYNVPFIMEVRDFMASMFR